MAIATHKNPPVTNSSRRAPETVIIAERLFPLKIARNARSRRMSLRFQPIGQHILLTLPRYASLAHGLSFLEERKGWLEQVICALPVPEAFLNGQSLPLFGKEYTLCHNPASRSVGEWQEKELHIGGQHEFFARRVKHAICKEARGRFFARANEYAHTLERKVKKITLKETTTRWGSCSNDGSISLSWRLAFAPEDVADYVIAHEVTHLVHHNHSDAFWGLLETLYPQHETQKNWLRTSGHTLYRFGM